MPAKKIYTIGHSTHPLEAFIGLLAQHDIEVVCDVRSHPYSQHNPQFNRESLKQDLRANGIKYLFLGKELGARGENPACYIDGKVQYHYLAEEPLFLEGLNRLRKGMEDYRIALMCAEKDPLACHRTILVCRELRGNGVEIKHIREDGGFECNRETERRLMELHHIEPDMLRPEEECIEAAYDQQAAKIAYVQKDWNREK